MCGIAGIINFKETAASADVVSAMCDAMQHRGPDNGTIITEKNICFGHQRLSIIDLSNQANQPMYSADKSILLVFNGEIYNFENLKTQLKDYPFKTKSDTEVVVSAYQKWGVEMVQHLEGMFAFALADFNNNCVYLGRDRFGKKPLYYVKNDEKFAFSSEIRPLIKTKISKGKINRQVLGEYLKFQTVHYPNTMVADIAMLKPATYIKVQNGKVEETHYWNPKKEEATASFEPKKLKELFYSAVEKRLVSDVPLAVLLSAGIDSNLILAAASKVQPVNSFTIGFEEKDFDESVLAAKAAKHFGSNHHEVKLSADDLMNKLPEVLDALDHPSGDGPNTYLISEMIKKQGFTVALSGLGGDELFFGYPHYALYERLRNSKAYQSTPAPILNMAASVLGNNKISKLASLKKAINHPAAAMAIFRANYSDHFLQKHFGINAIIFDDSAYKDLNKFNAMSMMEMEFYMCDVLLRDADQMSMAHSLELSNPFSDHTLAAYVWSVDAVDKGFFPAKKMLLDAMGKEIPDYILNKKKTGFTFPWDNWMRTSLHSFCELQMQYLEDTNLFKKGSIINAWQAFNKQSKTFTWSRIWPLVALAYWIKKQNIDLT